tara:strand:+ start:183 stop:707 length:525 start_codon:yes stop_codon:yes gene_type:complete
MLKKSKQISARDTILYNNILSLSRNKLFYTKFELNDTFQNRIHLIFIHISFLFIKTKQDHQVKTYKIFYQNVFDLIFRMIEQDMRELGYGDVTVNKNMKILVKTFYDILLNCENYTKKNTSLKNMFFSKYLDLNKTKKDANYPSIIRYFDKFQAFCFDLTPDSVLSGELNFKYK